MAKPKIGKNLRMKEKRKKARNLTKQETELFAR